MSDRLVRGLLRRLQRWHLQAVKSSLQSQATATVKPRQQKVEQGGNSGPLAHSELLTSEALELAQSELRWMLEDARRRGKSPSTTGRMLLGMVQRRVRHDEPLAYILGTQPFGPLEIQVRPPLLIPRPETEEWTLEVVNRLQSAVRSGHLQSKEPFRVLDLCCGTGCIGVTIAEALERLSVASTVHLLDKSPAALQCVADNVAANGLTDNAHVDIIPAHVDLIESSTDKLLQDLLALTHGQGFDLILCNPPYIPTDEYEMLDSSVKNWEDRDALCGDGGGTGAARDGLQFYRRVAELLAGPSGAGSHSMLLRGGNATRDARLPAIVFEVGKGQHTAVEEILRATRSSSTQRQLFSKVETWNDAFGVGRAVVAYTQYANIH